MGGSMTTRVRAAVFTIALALLVSSGLAQQGQTWYVRTGAAPNTTGPANSCERADIQAAIDAASDNDTVEVAAGDCNIPTRVLSSQKQLILRGAGAAWYRDITNATNASPIVLTFSRAHRYPTGSSVLVQSVGGNTNANGTWTVTCIDTDPGAGDACALGTSTQVSLNGSSGNAAYTSGGTANLTNSTILRSTVPAHDSANFFGSNLTVTMVEGECFRLTGFTFRNGTSPGDTSSNTANVNFSGSSDCVRVDRVQFWNIPNTAVAFTGNIRGVADSYEWQTNAFNHFTWVAHGSWGGVGAWGDNSWAQPDLAGTEHAMYFEDGKHWYTGTIMGGTVIDSLEGARWVVRHGEMVRTYTGCHDAGSGQRNRGTRWQEVYGNTYSTPNAWGPVARICGGGVFYDLVATGSYTTFFNIRTDRHRDDGSASNAPFGTCGHIGVNSITFSSTTATVTTAVPHLMNTNAWVTISGATGPDASLYNGTFKITRLSSTTYRYTMAGTPSANAAGTLLQVSPFDQNTDSRGYPCMDQVGRGQGILQSGGSSAGVTPPNIIGPMNQALSPVYSWNVQLNSVERTIGGSVYSTVGVDTISGTPRPGYAAFVHPHTLRTVGFTSDTGGGSPPPSSGTAGRVGRRILGR